MHFEEVSARVLVASAVGNSYLQQSDGLRCVQEVPATAMFVGLAGLIQAGKEKQIKIPRSPSSCNGFVKGGNLNVLSPLGNLENILNRL